MSMKKLSSVLIFIFVTAGIVICLTSSIFKNSIVKASSAQAARGFVVMELFTSQGCSSCPPADELLGKYAAQNNPNIIPLSFHVDYWNRLGWKDSFSNAGFSQRQRLYASSIPNSSIYTPQLIINGNEEMVGSEESKIASAVTKALALQPVVTIAIGSQQIKEGELIIQYSTTGNIAHNNILALLVQTRATTKIKAGENNGATLASYNVVRSMVSVPAKVAGSCTLTIPAGFISNNYSIVLLAQNTGSLKITGAVKKSI